MINRSKWCAIILLVTLRLAAYEGRIEPHMALMFTNNSNEKVHALFIGTNDFRHILDAGGWTNKAVKQLIDISEGVFKLLPDVDSSGPKPKMAAARSASRSRGEQDHKTESIKRLTQEEKDELLQELSKGQQPVVEQEGPLPARVAPMVAGAPAVVTSPETWIAATRGVLAAAKFLGTVLPAVATEAIKHKDHFKQVFPHLTLYTYKDVKKPRSQIVGIKDLTLAIFPDDEDGVAQFNSPLFVRSFNPEKYNAVEYGPTHGVAYFMKIDPQSGEVLKRTEKRFLPLTFDPETERADIADEGEDLLSELLEKRREK